MEHSKHNANTTYGKVLALCELALTKKNSREAELAAQIRQKLTDQPLSLLVRDIPRVGHRHYDKLIEDLFTTTATGIPRESFLQQVLNKFAELDGIAADGKSKDEQNRGKNIPIRFILQAERPRTNEPPRYQGFAAAGIQPQRWENYCQKVLPDLADSRLFDKLLFGRMHMEVLHSDYLVDYLSYRHEFGALLDRKTPFWINAVALPAGAPHYPDRALIALYPAASKLSDTLRVPSNAVQEWRVFHFIGIAYQHLSHQLAGLAEQIAARRSELLNELAPGILHHEMGACLNLLRANLLQQIETLSLLLGEYEHPWLDQLADDNRTLMQSAVRLYATVDAFNNIEQRRGRETVVLEELFKQLRTICYHRLGEAGVELRYQETDALSLSTDAALLLHLMLNIVLNAVNAIHEHPQTIPNKTILLSAGLDQEGGLRLDFLNNGPPIEPALRERLFQRGVTTRALGHGQGLYISRMIAHYLGGSLELADGDELARLSTELAGQPDFFKVCFRLETPLQLPDYKDLDSERRRHR